MQRGGWLLLRYFDRSWGAILPVLACGNYQIIHTQQKKRSVIRFVFPLTPYPASSQCRCFQAALHPAHHAAAQVVYVFKTLLL